MKMDFNTGGTWRRVDPVTPTPIFLSYGPEHLYNILGEIHSYSYVYTFGLMLLFAQR